VLGSTLLYLVVDFFDRIDNLLKAGVNLNTTFRYFLFKTPLSVSRVFGVSTLFAAFFSLGTLSRSHEVTAMRASGVSLNRLSLPIFLVSFCIAAVTFFWNETVVPLFTQKAELIYKLEVQKKEFKSLIRSKEIWFRGNQTFTSADYFDSRKNTLEGIAIYLLNQDFSLRGLIEAPRATWNGRHWQAVDAMEWRFSSGTRIGRKKFTDPLPIVETPEDFKTFAREPEELSFFDLKRQIEDLKGKGIDTTDSNVDLQVKMAVPLLAPLMVFLAIPFALRHGPKGGLALSFGLTTVIGMGYWFLLAFSVSLGHNGALSPLFSAWLPNFILGLVGFFFYTAED